MPRYQIMGRKNSRFMNLGPTSQLYESFLGRSISLIFVDGLWKHIEEGSIHSFNHSICFDVKTGFSSFNNI